MKEEERWRKMQEEGISCMYHVKKVGWFPTYEEAFEAAGRSGIFILCENEWEPGEPTYYQVSW